jgi:hypothetical protein
LFAASPPPEGMPSSFFFDAAHHYWPSSSSSSSGHPPPPPLVVAGGPRGRILAGAASAAATYLSLLFAHDRPRGRTFLPDPGSHLVVRPSLVPNGGLGLFAGRPMPGGTPLGTYPGVVRPAGAFLGGKCRAHPGAERYSWTFADGAYVIDPTDGGGELRDVCLGGGGPGGVGAPLSALLFATLFRPAGVSTALCRINEPPRGVGGCSVRAREDLARREVTFELVRDVEPGQELYLDYGPSYDRSGYGRPPPAADDNAR